MNKRKLDVFVINFKLNININDFDDFCLIIVRVIIKHKSFAKSFIHLYHDNGISVNVIIFQCLRNANI